MSSDTQEYLELSGINGAEPTDALLSEQAFPILKGLSPLSLRILNDASQVIQVSKGVEMLHEGDTSRELCFVKQGKMVIAKKVGDQTKVLTQLKTGDVYGEFGILRKKLRYTSVYTAQASEVIRVELSAVQQVLDADPHFKVHLQDLLCQRVLDSYLFSHPIFQSLPSEKRMELSNKLSIHFHHHGERLFKQGDKPNGVHLIISGEVEVYYLNRNREDILLEVRRDNDLLGELAAKNGEALAYSANATSDLDVLLLTPTSMKLIRETHLETFKKLEQYINKRAERTVARLKEDNHQTNI